MQSSTTTEQYMADTTSSTETKSHKLHQSLNKNSKYRNILDKCQQMIRTRGVHSLISMNAAGFRYTDIPDTARCDTCGLEISGWTSDMIPFTVHAQRSPTCAFVSSLRPNTTLSTLTSINNSTQPITAATGEETPSKRRKLEHTHVSRSSNILVEVQTLKEIRRRTFSHWPDRRSLSRSEMIEAGFFSCNVGDRVMCLYCNIICQEWIPDSDNPSEVHRTLSPRCPYVTTMLKSAQTSSIPIINEKPSQDDAAYKKFFQIEQIVTTAACHVAYKEITKRYASFNTWPNEDLPPIDDLVNAGFFFTGTNTIVTCFYCNGSLQNWKATDNPKIEHARWFPHCAYAKQLCGAKLCRNIQEMKRRQKEHHEKNDPSNQLGTKMGGSSNGQSNILDESILSRSVAARLDLPSSQSMLDRNFRLAIVKRCWEDQLRLKCTDFASNSDLLIACTILQKQIEHIDGKKENIIVPSVAMRKIYEKESTGLLNDQTTLETDLVNTSNDTDIEMSTSSESHACGTATIAALVDSDKSKDLKSASTRNPTEKGTDHSSSSNPCALCLTEDKCLAFVPCGHVATCVPCGHSLKSCPICRSDIKAFVRVYL